MNILVIKQTSLGDVLHSTGHVRAIKENFPAGRKFVKGNWPRLRGFRDKSLHAIAEMDAVLRLARERAEREEAGGAVGCGSGGAGSGGGTVGGGDYAEV